MYRACDQYNLDGGDGNKNDLRYIAPSVSLQAYRPKIIETVKQLTVRVCMASPDAADVRGGDQCRLSSLQVLVVYVCG